MAKKIIISQTITEEKIVEDDFKLEDDVIQDDVVENDKQEEESKSESENLAQTKLKNISLPLLELVKKNLILTHNQDDELITIYLTSALAYAEKYQHLESGYYTNCEMFPTTRQAIIMLASHFYESRDGSTGGFFNDNTNASNQVWNTVNRLLTLDKEWLV